ncbi:hypothetical protein RJ55_06385 [Drechmeria coniospora]|nr:hypothetical protein RJ55_06385 [Drechmeria coniospora]
MHSRGLVGGAASRSEQQRVPGGIDERAGANVRDGTDASFWFANDHHRIVPRHRGNEAPGSALASWDAVRVHRQFRQGGKA